MRGEKRETVAAGEHATVCFALLSLGAWRSGRVCITEVMKTPLDFSVSSCLRAFRVNRPEAHPVAQERDPPASLGVSGLVVWNGRVVKENGNVL